LKLLIYNNSFKIFITPPTKVIKPDMFSLNIETMFFYHKFSITEIRYHGRYNWFTDKMQVRILGPKQVKVAKLQSLSSSVNIIKVMKSRIRRAVQAPFTD